MDSASKGVELMTAEQTRCVRVSVPDRGVREALDAIASGDAATYNVHTHELLPKGTREAVERVIAEMRDCATDRVRPVPRTLARWADELQRAIEVKPSGSDIGGGG